MATPKSAARAFKKKAKPIPSMWAHQKKTVAFGRRKPRMLDFSDPGTGKTRAHLELFAERRRKGSKAALIVAPKSLLEVAWGDDAAIYVNDMKLSIAYAENRDEAFSTSADIYITNTDAVKWLAKKPKTFFKKFDTLIIDELTAFKNPTSQRSKAIRKISKYFKYRAGLTGTPNDRTITEVWHQALIIDDGEHLGTSFYKFRSQCCQPVQTGPSSNMVSWVDIEGIEDTVAYILKDITIRHEFDKVMNIPENRRYYRHYRPSKKLLGLYESLARNAIIDLQQGTVNAVNKAVLQNKLMQVASGAVYLEGGEYEVLDTGRYELILDLIEERKHSVVFFNWQHQKDQLMELARRRGITHELIDGTVPKQRRTGIVRAYQAGRYQTLFLHPQTGAHGLTLTKGTTTIWSSPIYLAGFLKQGIHRVYRGGQTEETETIMVEAIGTLERTVYEKLDSRTSKMVSFLEVLLGG